jgi:hypothetical protein
MLGMKDVMMYMGVFVVGYLLTMGFLFVVLRLVFPAKGIDEGEDLTTLINYAKKSKVQKTGKIKIING